MLWLGKLLNSPEMLLVIDIKQHILYVLLLGSNLSVVRFVYNSSKFFLRQCFSSMQYLHKGIKLLLIVSLKINLGHVWLAH